MPKHGSHNTKREQIAARIVQLHIQKLNDITQKLNGPMFELAELETFPAIIRQACDSLFRNQSLDNAAKSFLKFNSALCSISIYHKPYNYFFNLYLRTHYSELSEFLSNQLSMAWLCLAKVVSAHKTNLIKEVLNHLSVLITIWGKLCLRKVVLHVKSDPQLSNTILGSGLAFLHSYEERLNNFIASVSHEVLIVHDHGGTLLLQRALIQFLYEKLGVKKLPQASSLIATAESAIKEKFDDERQALEVVIADCLDPHCYQMPLNLSEKMQSAWINAKKAIAVGDWPQTVIFAEELFIEQINMKIMSGKTWVEQNNLLAFLFTEISSHLYEQLRSLPHPACHAYYMHIVDLTESINRLLVFLAPVTQVADFSMVLKMHSQMIVGGLTLLMDKTLKNELEQLFPESGITKKTKPLLAILRDLAVIEKSVLKQFDNVLDAYPFFYQQLKECQSVSNRLNGYCSNKGLQSELTQKIAEKIKATKTNLEIKLKKLIDRYRVILEFKIRELMQEKPILKSLYDRLCLIGKVYFTGGLLRDLVLGSMEFRDIDLKVAFNMSLLLSMDQAVLRNAGDFPTVSFVWKEKRVDVTQLWGTVSEHASQCDAAINALFYNPDEGLIASDALLHDCIMKQLRSPDPTQLEHHTDRVMRILHYTARLNLSVETETANALIALAQDYANGAKQFKMAGTRLSFEINKAFLHGMAEIHWGIFEKYQWFLVVFPWFSELNPKQYKQKLKRDLSDLDHKVNDEEGYASPDEFYIILLKPYVEFLLMRPKADCLQAVEYALQRLQERITLQKEPPIATYIKNRLIYSFSKFTPKLNAPINVFVPQMPTLN